MMNLKPYVPMVKKIANQMALRLPSNIEADDLVQVGLMAVYAALGRYDPSHESKAAAETFLGQRARGAMIDYLRGEDHLPRSVRKRLKKTIEVERSLEAKFGHRARESEIAENSGMSLNEYQMLRAFAGLGAVPIEDVLEPESQGSDPLDILEGINFDAELVACIAKLDERHQMALKLFYYDDMSQEAIGRILGCTGANVSRMNAWSLKKIRPCLS